MAIDRRHLLRGAAGLGLSAWAIPLRASSEPAPRLFSAARVKGVDGAALWQADGLVSSPLPGRAHALLPMPSGEILLMGRRPGKFAAFVDPHTGHETRRFAPLKGMRFAGHAALLANSAFATSEIDAQTAEGWVAVRDANGRVREAFPLGGIEPHDLVFADGRLVVAMGGIAYAADVKGPAMNAGAIDSQLIELDVRTGAVLARHRLVEDMRSLSIRHLALVPDGRVIFGMQDQDKSRLRPLMGALAVGRDLSLLGMPQGEETGALRFYIGSVASDVSGRYVVATSPKGGVAGLWSLTSGRFLGGLKVMDVCGLAADSESGHFWLTSGLGDVVRVSADNEGLQVRGQWRADAAFDNHLAFLGARALA